MSYPEIYNASETKLAVLNNITSNRLMRKINSFYEFDFSCFEENLKTEYITLDNMVLADDNYFDISSISVNHNASSQIKYDVICEHVFYRLSEDTEFNYAYTGTPTEILTDLLAGTDFTAGTVDFTSNVVFAVNREASIMNIIIALAAQLGAEIGFQSNGFTIDLLDSLGADNGFQIRLEKNMKGITYKVENRGELKTSYEVDVVDIYKSDQFADMTFIETVDIGDTVQVINEVLNLDVSQAVLEIEKDVISGRNLKLTLANSFDSLADDISFLQENAIKQTDIIYGVKINDEVGIEIERDDLLARTILNAEAFRMQVGDGLGSYTDSLYFDATAEKYIFAGRIETNDITVFDQLLLEADTDVAEIVFADDDGFTFVFWDGSTDTVNFLDNVRVRGNLVVDGTIT